MILGELLKREIATRVTTTIQLAGKRGVDWAGPVDAVLHDYELNLAWEIGCEWLLCQTDNGPKLWWDEETKTAVWR